MKLDFSGQIFEKSSDTKFHKNPSSERRVVLYGWKGGRANRQTDMAKC